MSQVHLLRALPQGQPRDIEARKAAKTPQVVATARRFGKEYFDGARHQGYGGYHDDGRWIPVAGEIADHYKLEPGDRVLDIGCAKGFLIKELIEGYGLDAFGLDVSRYAVQKTCLPSLVGRLHLGNAMSLPFPDQSFDLVLSINTIHNLDAHDCLRALREIQRVSKGKAFVQVDAYRNDEERQRFEAWVLTAKTHGTPEFWCEMFERAGYGGDYDWTIV